MKNPSSSRDGCSALDIHLDPARRKVPPVFRYSTIEPLESRYAPATFTGTGGPALDIVLDHDGETITVVANGATYTVLSNFNAVDGGNTGGDVSGFGTVTATITADAFTIIHITDGATTTSVTFGASGVNAYSSAIDIVLDDPTAGGLTFTGASNFAGTSGVSGGVCAVALPVAARPIATNTHQRRATVMYMSSP